MRVGLVLGAGGVLGGAWLVGALDALARRTGWDPGSAERIVGTSAGSMVGSLLASGVPPWFMVAHSAGEEIAGVTDADGRPASEADRSAGARFRLHPGLPALGPGSWRLALASLARPYRYSPAALLAAWAPAGLFSTEPLKDTVRRAAGDQWPPHPGLWITATDNDTGRRVVFGRAGAPSAALADAVAASCAIPGFYRPVRIGGRRYVDGGVWSTSNLDLVAGEGLDLVVCLNPTSSRDQPSSLWPPERMAGLLRRQSGRRLGRESRRVREAGTDVVLLQPTAEDLETMGINLMSGRRRHDVIVTAGRTVARSLEQPGVAELLEALPAGEPALVRRPEDPPERWPDFRALAATRWSAAAA